MKIYPKRVLDNNGMKFIFDTVDYHYTIRFAGKPLILLQQLYEELGGKDFIDTYNRMKKKLPVKKDDVDNMKVAMKMLDVFLNAMYKSDLSPIVIYRHNNLGGRNS